MKKDIWKVILRKTFVFLMLVLIWQFIFLVIKDSFLVPAPESVFRRLFTLLGDAVFWKTILYSFSRVAISFIIGVVFGIVFSAVMGLKKLANDFLSLVILIIQSVPVVAFITLVLVWVKSEYIPLLISVLSVCPLVVRNLRAGMKSISAQKIFSESTVKSVKPFLFASCRSGSALAFKSCIAAEVLAKTDISIGGNIAAAKDSNDTVLLFCWIVVVVILSIVLDFLSVRVFRENF